MHNACDEFVHENELIARFYNYLFIYIFIHWHIYFAFAFIFHTPIARLREESEVVLTILSLYVLFGNT
jgi:hypothetical protein